MPYYYPRRLHPSLFLVRVRIIKCSVCCILDFEGLFPTLLIKLFISVHPLEGDIGLDYTHEKQDFIKSAHLIKEKIVYCLFVLFSVGGGVVDGM